MARGVTRLNLMVKGWMAKGANLWRREQQVVYLVTGQASYTYGTDNITTVADTNETTLDAAEAASQTVLSVTSTSGFANSDVIGIKLDDGTIDFTTISSFVTNDTVTVATGLTSAAASGNNVYTYTTKATSPTKILFAYRRDPSDIDTPVALRSRDEYSNQTLKSTTGVITEVHHDRQLTSKLFVWPTGEKSLDKLILIADRYTEDFDAVANTPDYPAEWMNALVWGLSSELSNVYGLPLQERAFLKSCAEQEFNEANTYDVEGSHIQFQYARDDG